MLNWILLSPFFFFFGIIMVIEVIMILKIVIEYET